MVSAPPPRCADSPGSPRNEDTGKGGLNSPGCTETRPHPHPHARPPSPALDARGRGHSGPPALRSASPVPVPCTPAGPRPREPDSARPPSARGIPPGPVPLRAEAGFRRAQSGPPGHGASPALRVEDNRRAGWWSRLLLPFPRLRRGATLNPLHIPMASRAPSGAGQEGDCGPAGSRVLGPGRLGRGARLCSEGGGDTSRWVGLQVLSVGVGEGGLAQQVRPPTQG